MAAQVFKAFEYREFRLLWIGACISSIGTWMQLLAQSWLVYKISGEAFYLGLDTFLGQIPIVLLSLLGGAIADRQDRRALLLMSQVVQLICAFTLAGLFAFTDVKIWEILTLSFVVGVAQAFGGPAYQALLPSLVKGQDISNAIALNSIQFNVARVIGPMLGGLALANLGAAWCFGLNGLSFLAVILALLSVSVRFMPKPSTQPLLASMKEGISFIRCQPNMATLIVLAFGTTLLGMPLINFLPVFAKEIFRGGPDLFTLFLCMSGAGSVAGALTVAGLSRRGGKGKLALLMLILLGILIVGFSLSRSLVFSCVMIFIAGAALIAVFALVSSLVQLITKDEMRGRVMSVYNIAFRGGAPVGSLLAGWLIQSYTAPVVLACNGVLMVALGLYFFFVQRRITTL